MSRAYETVADRPTTSRAARWCRDLATLSKLRISSFVFLAAAASGYLAGGPEAGLGRILEAALWTALLAASASAFNQIIERTVDAKMDRTSDRPLPAGRVGVVEALAIASLWGLVGTVALALRFNPFAALLGLSTLVAYTLVYTPLKRLSSFNTLVGAIPGAAPPLVGYAAIAGDLGPWAWSLFGVIFAWQFPHFLAIAWLYREDYARAGMKMLPALEGCASLAGRQGFLYSLVIIPVSLLPALRGDAGLFYVSVAILLGLFYVGSAAAFALRATQRRARSVLFTSLFYLPLLLIAAIADPVVRANVLS